MTPVKTLWTFPATNNVIHFNYITVSIVGDRFLVKYNFVATEKFEIKLYKTSLPRQKWHTNENILFKLL